MRRHWALATLLAAGCATTPPVAMAPASIPQEVQTLAVPGFADFLAVDGESVWATNKGRVERWSRQGKRAEVAMSHPCGAMAVASGSLWVADCKDRTLNRIDLQTAKTVAVVPTGVLNALVFA